MKTKIKTLKMKFDKVSFLATITVALFFSINFAQAQNDLKENTYWRVENYNWQKVETPPYEWDHFQYVAKGDTLISSVAYKKIYKTGGINNSASTSPLSFFYKNLYIGALRYNIIDKKMFFVKKNSPSESLLYDFTLGVHDTLPITENNKVKNVLIENVDSVMLNDGKKYKRYCLKRTGDIGCGLPLGSDYIIEGIGYLGGLLEDINRGVLGESVGALACYGTSALTNLYVDPNSGLSNQCEFITTNQNWCAPGATWTHDFREFLQYRYYAKTAYVGDTTINNLTCKKMDVQYFEQDRSLPSANRIWQNSITKRLYTYADADLVYIFRYNKFDTLYNFSAQVGDTWSVYNKNEINASCKDSIGIVKVDSIGTITINGNTLRYVCVSPKDANQKSGWTAKIIEKVGPTPLPNVSASGNPSFQTHLFPGSIGLLCGVADYGVFNADLLSYKDDAFDYKLDKDVWPGDADYNGIANNLDLLQLGMAWGQNNGSTRPAASINWEAQFSLNWGVDINGVDQKHADCNGDGVIGFADTTAILQNYNQLHTLKLAPNIAGANDPTLLVDFPAGNYSNGAIINVPIKLGNTTISASNVYGLAFTIDYPTTGFDATSVKANFNNSWMGVNNTEIVGLQKNFPANKQIDIALTRINKTNITGNGTVCEISIRVDNLGGITALKLANIVEQISLSKASLIDKDGVLIPINLQGDSVQIISSINDVNLEKSISVYPNPATDNVVITSAITIESIVITDIAGKQVYASADTLNNTTINTSSIESGIYFITIQTDAGVIRKKLTVKH